MAFSLPTYVEPDFQATALALAPDARWGQVLSDGVAPRGFHSTSMYPEYFKVGGAWRLAEESRMDSSVVLRPDGRLDVVENRNLRAGDLVCVGRTEDGSEGIYVHADGFVDPSASKPADKFVFRQGRSRETAFTRDYDRLFELLRYERENGKVIWVMGPAFAFDHDARFAMQRMIEAG